MHTRTTQAGLGRGSSSYLLPDPAPLLLLSQHHSTALPSPRRYERRYDERYLSQGESRFEALYVLALTTGLRIGELLGLRWSDIDFDTRRLRVSRQVKPGNAGTSEGLIFTEPKAARRRTVDLPTRTIEALKRHRKGRVEEKLKAGGAYQDNALVFATSLGTPFGPETVTQRSFKPLLRRTVLPEIRFHDLRHTYATLLLARGVHPTYVQRALGHASVKMTLDRYSHWMPSMGRATAEAIDAALG